MRARSRLRFWVCVRVCECGSDGSTEPAVFIPLSKLPQKRGGSRDPTRWCETRSVMLGVLAGSSLAQSSSDGDHAQRLKFEIWQRGLPECGAHGCSAANSAADLSALQLRWMYTRSMPIAALRGGSDGCAGTACEPDAVDLDQLRASMARLVVLAAAELATTARACASRLSPTALWAPEQSLRRLAPAVQPRGLTASRPSTLQAGGARSRVWRGVGAQRTRPRGGLRGLVRALLLWHARRRRRAAARRPHALPLDGLGTYSLPTTI